MDVLCNNYCMPLFVYIIIAMLEFDYLIPFMVHF